MKEFGNWFELGIACKLFLQKVFDRLDVVIGAAFNGFDALGILEPKTATWCNVDGRQIWSEGISRV